MLFLEIVAIIFLIIFIFKMLYPKVLPAIGRGFNRLFKLIGKGFKILVESFFYTIYLLITRTVYMVGIIIIVSLLLGILFTFINNPINSFSSFFDAFKNSILIIYVKTFFIGTYILGFINYIIVRGKIKQNFFNFITLKINRNFSKKYFYDEATNKYTYKE